MEDSFENSRPEMASYRELAVWKKGIDLAKHVYRLTTHFPASELYGLVSQLRRAAVSVPSNIAEGQARRTDGEFIRFLQIALGSLAEIDTQFVLAVEFEYLPQSEFQAVEKRVNELRRMLHGLVRSLARR